MVKEGKKIKVAFFSAFPLETGGGCERYFIDTARELMRLHGDLEVTIVTPGGRLLSRISSLLSVYYGRVLSAGRLNGEKTTDIRVGLGDATYTQAVSLSELRAVLRSADVVYTKNEILDLALLRLSHGLRLPKRLIVGCHTPLRYPHTASMRSAAHNILYGPTAYSRLASGVAAFHVLNAHDERFLRAAMPHVSITNIPCPMYMHDTAPSGQHHGALRVLFIGRLSEQKGYDLFLDMVRALSRKSFFEELSFRIVGPTRTDSAFMEATRAIETTHENVRYLGRIPHNETVAQYDWADVIVVPSRFETMNLVTLEAGSRAKIVMATDIPGPADIIIDQRTGFLLPFDVDAFVERLSALYGLRKKEPEAFRDIGEAAYRRVAKDFDPVLLHGKLREVILRVARSV